MTPGSGATVAADDVSGVLYQRVKLDIGGDGVSTTVTDLSTSALQTTGNTSLSSIDTKTPALGQALAAASVPVVLTASQLTTLTPPAAITNFAQETGGNLATLAGTVTSSVLQSNVKQVNGVTVLMGNGTTGTGSQRVTIASDNTAFSVNATLSAETTKVIGVTRTADGSGNLITSTTNALDINIKSGNLTTLPVTNTGTFAVQATLQTQTDTVMVGGVNVKEINAVTPLMGNGVTGTGSLRVTIASDNTAFSVNSTLSAETTKVIGVVRNSDGAGNLLTSNSTTPTAKFALDSNITSILGTAPTTVGKLDVKGADGDVFVRQTTAANLNAQITIAAAQTLATVTTVATVTNLAQMNGAALLMGNGVTGTGAQRVTLASDNTAIAGWGQGATGSAVPSGAQYQGLNTATALPTAATPGNLIGMTGDKYGRPVVLNNAMRDIMGTQTTTITSSTAETTIITQTASIFHDLMSIFISNTSATAARVDIRDTTGGSVIFQLYIPAGDMRGISLTTPWPQTTVNTNWTAQSSASIADLRVSALYISNK